MKKSLRVFIVFLVCVCIVGCSGNKEGLSVTANEDLKEKLLIDGWTITTDKHTIYIEHDEGDNIFTYNISEEVLGYNGYIYNGSGFVYNTVYGMNEDVNDIITGDALRCLETYDLTVEDMLNFMAWCKNEPSIPAKINKGIYDSVSLEFLARYSDGYIGDYIKVSGEIIQVIEDDSTVQYLVNGNSWSDDFQENTFLVSYSRKNGESRFLDGDNVTVYGQYRELQTYETVLGSSKTVPFIYAEFIEHK